MNQTKLTSKQEKLCQAVADGMSQADAYRHAFDVKPTTKPETVQQMASRLMADRKVSARVSELRDQLSAKALWTREMSVKALLEACEIAKESRNPAGMTGAIKELNSMHGFNAPQEVHMTTKEYFFEVARAGSELS